MAKLDFRSKQTRGSIEQRLFCEICYRKIEPWPWMLNGCAIHLTVRSEVRPVGLLAVGRAGCAAAGDRRGWSGGRQGGRRGGWLAGRPSGDWPGQVVWWQMAVSAWPPPLWFSCVPPGFFPIVKPKLYSTVHDCEAQHAALLQIN